LQQYFVLLLLLLRDEKGALTGTICTWFAVAKKIRIDIIENY